MAYDINTLTITGVLGKPPEFHEYGTTSGERGRMAILSLCFNVWDSKEQRSVPNWIRVVTFDKAAVRVAETSNLMAGSKLVVNGSLRVTYNRETGKQYSEINANTIAVISYNKQQQGNSQGFQNFNQSNQTTNQFNNFNENNKNGFGSAPSGFGRSLEDMQNFNRNIKGLNSEPSEFGQNNAPTGGKFGAMSIDDEALPF